MLAIKRLAIETDWNGAFSGKSMGNRHLFRVVKLARHMAKRLGAEAEIVEAGAWLHDTALPSGNDYSYKRNKQIVEKLLKDFQLSEKESGTIAECVASHEGTKRPRTLEAKIVHDADVLEKTGILGIIRHTWKLTNSGRLSWGNITKGDTEKVLAHLQWRSNKMQTSLGKTISSYLSVPITVEQATVIISIVAPKAFCGVVTEKIAPLLYKRLTAPQKNRLREQLSMSYLKKF